MSSLKLGLGLSNGISVGKMGFPGGGSVVYSVSGIVYDADGSTPVSGATVALGALTAVSAANGTYTISNVPAGTSGSMTCTKAGYSWTAITVAAMSGNLTNQNYTNAWWAAGGCAASALAAYKAKGAASLAASYVNLVNPGTNNAAPGVAPNFDPLAGWQFTGTQYLVGPTVSNGFMGMLCYADLVVGAGDRVLTGSDDANKQVWIMANRYWQYKDAFLAAPGAPVLTASGVVAISPSFGWLNASKFALSNAPGVMLAGGPLGIGASYQGNYKVVGLTLPAAVYYTAAITDDQYEAVRAAMSNF